MKLENFDTGSANPTLNRNIIHPEVVAWPPKNEQKEISNYLDNSSTKTDHLISKYQSTINLLLEYRITLISEVVTGKIDVREEAVP